MLNLSNSNVIEQLENKLLNYMELHEIAIDHHGKFLCPAHNDTSPSASINPKSDNKKWKCFSCGAGSNIYDMAYYVEKLDFKDKAFIPATKHLMNQFDDLKDIQDFKLDEKDLLTVNIYRLTRYIYDMFAVDTYKKQHEFSNKRGWSKRACYELGIGTIPYINIKEALLEKTGIDISHEPYKDMFMPALFSSRGLVFTLFDHADRPIGFSTRNVDWVKGDRYGKYVNSPDIEGIFKKDKHLFHVSKSLESNKEHGFVYLFEGNANMVTAYENGIFNTTAICGTNFSENQIDLLKRVGIYHVVFCLDADEAGIKATKKILADKRYLEKGLHVEIVDIPVNPEKDKCDADYYIKTYGADAFRKIPRLPAFEWLLSKVPSGTPPAKVVEEMVPHIALTPNQSAWQAKINTLHEFTGIEIEYIKNDVIAHNNTKEAELKNERQKIVERAFNEVRAGGNNVVSSLQKAIKQIQTAEEKKNGPNASVEDNIAELEVIFKDYHSYDASKGTTGWETGYQGFDHVFDGVPKHSAYMGFPGLPHMGKSAFVLNVITKMLMLTDEGKNQDLAIHVMTIDDSFSAIAKRMLGIMTNIDIHQLKKFSIIGKPLQDVAVKAELRFKNWIKKGHLYVADSRHTTNLETGINSMLRRRKQFPDKNNLFILDNFHKLATPAGFKERSAWIELSRIIHERVVADHFTTMATFELNKSAHHNDAPTLADISETGCIEYDAHGLALCHCYYPKVNDTKYKWLCKGMWYPIFELNVAKNKINEHKKKLYYAFNSSTTIMTEIPNLDSFLEENRNGNDSTTMDI